MTPTCAPIRVATWNVHGCIGRHGRFRPTRTAQVIRGLDPDVIALQEVDSRYEPGIDPDVFEILSDAVGGHSIHARTVSSADGHYGQMLVSRWPLDEPEIHDISVPGCEPRRVIEARLALPDGPLQVYATHFGLRASERRRQFAMLADIVAARCDRPRVLLGDLNEWLPFGPDRPVLGTLFDRTTRQRSFPARLPVLALDRIACRPGTLMKRAWADASARDASDHLPVAADLIVGGR